MMLLIREMLFGINRRLENETEQQLITAARRGDTQAFGRLYETYYATLVWLAYAILLDREAAEDAAQQAFVKACEKLGDLKQWNRFGSWLGRICRNEAYQLLRERQRRLRHAQSGSEPMVETESRHSEDQQSLVKAAVDGLPEMYREVVVLHYYQRLNYRGIAKVLDIAGHTVRGRLFRARRMIKQTLDKNGYIRGQAP